MHSNNSWARGFMALFAIVLAMGLALAASPAEAAPFAYVANNGSKTVSVIDTATNKVVATVPVGSFPFGVAVTPDGTHVYVTNSDSTVSVIKTATNTVVKTISVGSLSLTGGVAVTPDGTKVYVTTQAPSFPRICGPGSVSGIHRPGNTVVKTVPTGCSPVGVVARLIVDDAR